MPTLNPSINPFSHFVQAVKVLFFSVQEDEERPSYDLSYAVNQNNISDHHESQIEYSNTYSSYSVQPTCSSLSSYHSNSRTPKNSDKTF